MNKEQLSSIRHTQNNGKVGFCTDVNDPNMIDLVERGIFLEPIGMGMVGKGCGIFHLTREGRNFNAEPEPEKCPACNDNGMIYTTALDPPEQCEFCYNNPNSLFNRKGKSKKPD